MIDGEEKEQNLPSYCDWKTGDHLQEEVSSGKSKNFVSDLAIYCDLPPNSDFPAPVHSDPHHPLLLLLLLLQLLPPCPLDGELEGLCPLPQGEVAGVGGGGGRGQGGGREAPEGRG